ncbi:MAG: hypothetical protein QOJ01_1938 [Solirubrobacterales bacterium]|nr:hypothetical protein [Solirubrobacterales bacterium]
MTDLLVRRDDLRETRIAETPRPNIEDGQALLRVDRFGLTANNVTYAVFGEAMSYWSFFPAEVGWGRVPVWGFADVEESLHPDVDVDGRVYGYLPPSSYVVVTPGDADARGFVDASAHRKPLPSAYQRYLLSDEDPFYSAATEDLQMLLRPLFFTSFLLADDLLDGGLDGARTVVISSASSKTAIGTAFVLAEQGSGEVEVIGLTSARSIDFVEGLDTYDRVVAYEDVGSITAGSAAYVDISGDGAIRRAVHAHFGEALRASVAVGATAWEELGAGEGERPGPTPRFFFAPDRVTKRSADWGRAGLEERVAGSWQPFVEWVATWLEVESADGFGAVQKTYLDLLENRVGPRVAHVFSV